MGPNAPNEFASSDKFIIVSGMIEFDVNTSEETREDICDVIRASKSSRFDLSLCTPNDIEFVKCAGEVCRIPDTSSHFTWNGKAVKHLWSG